MTRRFPGVWAPLAAAVVVSAVLLSATFIIYRGVRDASHLVARGLGEGIAISGWETLRGASFPPTQEALERFLAQHQDDGLRYVAVLEPGGRVLASAGEAQGAGLEDGLTMLAGRARLVSRLRPPRPPRGQAPPVPPTDERELRRRLPRVVYEFEPLAALQLEARSRDLLVVAGLACVGVLGLALLLSRSSRQQERLRGELEHGRRLAALGSMSAVLAHELRNPLASLKGHAQLLAESVEQDARLSPRAERVVGEAVRLERLLNDLLAFVKSGELQRAPTDPSALLRAAVEAAGPEAIHARYLDGAAGPVSLDAGRLQQALENVLRNAVQASQGGGAGAPVEAAVALEGGDVVFTVRDRGPGIPAGEEERIFEPFVTRRVKGVGLGLAITRRIVELHGGQVAARNRADGAGAEFRIRIPRR